MRTACLALCGALVLAATALTAAPALAAAPPKVSAASVFRRPLRNPDVYVTTSALYVSWMVGRSVDNFPPDELSRVNAATGGIEAERYLGAQLDDALMAGGSLWAMTTAGTNEITLLRLNPVTLAVTGRLALGAPVTGGSNLAAAGGGLWVAAGAELLRVSLPGGRVTVKIPLRGANNAMVAANATGTVLLDGEANDGLGAVQRRDPRTGRLLASSAPLIGVVEPRIGGVIDSGIWTSEPTGMMGYVERLGLTGLKPPPSPGRAHIEGTNGIAATVADGLVWITQPEAGPDLNYCGDPRTGRRLAAIPLPRPDADTVLAIGTRYIYYVASSGTSQHLARLPIPTRCLAAA